MELKHLWQEYENQLRQFLRSRVKNPADLDDLLQEILLKTNQHLHTVKDSEKLVSWLFQIARNTLIDYYRKSRVSTSRQDIVKEAILTDTEPEEYEQIRRELTNCIRPFLNQLPEKYREAIELVDLQGSSQKELAHQLGLSHSAVKSRVQRGRSMLKAKFEECCRYQLDIRGNIIDYETKLDNCTNCQA